MRIAICEDELEIANLLKDEILNIWKSIKDKDISVKIFANSFGLMDYIENNSVDAVFMDVYLGRENGIELASDIQNRFGNVKVIFITGYVNCVEDVFDVVPFSMLMKPIKEERIKKVLMKLDIATMNDKGGYIILENKEGIHTVEEKDIIYVESNGRYINVILDSTDKIRVIMTMRDAQSRLSDRFMQVHRSYIVNLEKIKKLEKGIAVMRNGVAIPIRRGSYHMVYERYMERMRGF